MQGDEKSEKKDDYAMPQNDEIQILLSAVREAGDTIVKLQQSGFSVTRKSNNDLLTQADLAANDILKSRLTKAFPEIGWLSEESVDDEGRLACDLAWVVDPIDGTIEYATGIPEYAVSVALVERGKPVLACVFNPAANEFYHAILGEGAWLNDKRIRCTDACAKRLRLLASRSEYKRGEWDQFQQQHEVKQVGSIAYKLALVAAGKADATFSLGPKSEWDIAAGVLLVTEAGGKATDQERKPFLFNQVKVRVKGIVASAASVNDYLFQVIA